MSPFPRPAAIIFDVDGTLAETEEIHRRSFNDAFASLGVNRRWPDALRGWRWNRDVYRRLLRTTGGKERIAAYLAGDLGLDPGDKGALIADIHAAKTRRFAELLDGGEVVARAGVEGIIDAAVECGVRLAIATTTTRTNVDALCHALFDQAAERIFEVIAAGDEVRHKKPAPDVYDLALARLGLPPERCIALEDSRNGLLAAKSAGLRCIVCPSLYTEGEDFIGAERVVDTFDWDDLIESWPH